ncbi:MAG: ribulose-phosphate 3-epimerase [Oscillospiraceae bacterium]|nr:ribulose-phosphate 3-epimerase [Oscillospiraceae bacterium]
MAMISASILNADFTCLAKTADLIETAGADAVHFDVMDGIFVDNLSFGLPVLESLRRYTALPIDVHLMIQEPLRFVERFVSAGAQYLSFHIESQSDPVQTLQAIHSHGIPAGIAVSPGTDVEKVFPLIPEMDEEDFFLMMTVEPGWGKQPFIPEVLPKIRKLSGEIRKKHRRLHIEVDGGINAETSLLCRQAGADYIVSGSYLLSAKDPAEAVRLLRGDKSDI